MKIRLFGQIAGEIGSDFLEMDNAKNTKSLMDSILLKYPNLKDKKFLIVVNKKVIHQNTMLDEHSEVALLPPYSGG